VPIAFPEIPLPFLPPLYYADIVPGQAPYSASLRALLFASYNRNGYRGMGVASTPYILSGTLADQLAGRGSMLSSMYSKFRLNAPFAEVWGVMVPPQNGATAATGAIRINSTPSISAPLYLSIAGNPFSVKARAGDAPSLVASRVAAAINAMKSLPVSAGTNGGNSAQVDLTCKWEGASGNHISVRSTFWGKPNTLASIVTITPMGTGTGSFSDASVLSSLGKQKFDVFAAPAYGGLGSDVTGFMDGVSGRWSPLQQQYGHFFTAMGASYASLITYAANWNDPHLSVMGVYNSPSPEWDWAAAVAAKATQHWAEPPELSRPLQGLPLLGIAAPDNLADTFDAAQDDALLQNGISTWTVDDSRQVSIGRLVTTRRLNDYGDEDPSWRDAITMFQTQYFIRRMRAAVTTAFPRAALSDTDLGIPGFASPGAIRDLYIHEYKAMEAAGLVENSDAFAASLVVERNATDPNRVDSLIRPDFVNQLRVVANLIQTFLEIDSVQASATVA
jgi:phage tail sheath gpL-like